MNLHDKIRRLRKNNGYNQTEIAKKLHIEQTTYSNWENGKTDLTIKNLGNLGAVYNMTYLEVITYQDEVAEGDIKRQFDFQKSLSEAYSQNAIAYKALYETSLKENEALRREVEALKNAVPPIPIQTTTTIQTELSAAAGGKVIRPKRLSRVIQTIETKS